MPQYDMLKLENQLCFPLYACAKEVVRLYTPHLSELGLTYTQYIAMMVVWQQGELPVKELGRRLYLDSGTLTPLLKKLEEKGLVTRQRDARDERSVLVSATAEGFALREKATEIPARVGGCIPLDAQEAQTLYQLLYRILGQVSQ